MCYFTKHNTAKTVILLLLPSDRCFKLPLTALTILFWSRNLANYGLGLVFLVMILVFVFTFWPYFHHCEV